MERRKKSGQIQIPTFGNWDYTNELPITQYFESARQAGLVRYNTGSSSSSSSFSSSGTEECGDLYVLGDFIKPPLPSSPALILPPTKKIKTRTKTKTKTKGVVREKRRAEVKAVEEKNLKKGHKVRDVMEPPPTKMMVNNDDRYHHQQQKSRDFGGGGGGVAVRRMPPPKPVDEDLYKISPDLLHTSKRKKMLGFFSRCLYPTCVV